MEEGRRLQRISRTATDAVRLRRAIVVMMSAQGQSVPDITSLMQVSADYVRDVIHAFNERGFEALDPKWSGGRVFPPTYGSWLNWIESEFAALRYFALNGTDHRSHGEQNAAIGAYVRWRNARAEPKTSFAPDSPIPHLDRVPGQGCLTVRYPSVGCCRGGPAGNPGAAARRAPARSPARPSRPG
ncbi:hypothetical protein GCM10009579_66280 [Streptomyces javensis]|uniref:Insertion element IS150 protein InsJ-like helix-turn-helix domain-containing protein n=2 Tax=Streptomyces javensis TaxID=114698 RepID=A0ABP4HVZ4_9ACTN